MRNLDHKNGFTLVEIIVSLAIIAIISILFVSVYGSSLKITNNSVSGNETSASAQTIIEQIDPASDTAPTPSSTLDSFTLTFGNTTFSATGVPVYQGDQSVYSFFEVKK